MKAEGLGPLLGFFVGVMWLVAAFLLTRMRGAKLTPRSLPPA